MSNYKGFKRKSTRTASIEAAKRIKNNVDANKFLSDSVKEEYRVDETKMVTPFTDAITNKRVNDVDTQRKCRKKKISNELLDSKVQIHDLSPKTSKLVAAYPSKRKDMAKRGRGRPPKAEAAKYSFRSNTSTCIYEDIYDFNKDVNVRRESYNTSLLKSESSSPKQLQPGNGCITYRESLMKFCKDLGPTARKIALRKVLGQGLNYHTRHRLEPLLPLSDTQSHPCFLDMNSTNSSVRDAKQNQVSQPFIGFGALMTDSTADYKGKRIMVGDCKSTFNKWDAGDNLEFLFGKQKPMVEIFNNYQENVSAITGGYGSSENQDFVCSNLGYGQVGNWRSINQIGSLLSNYSENLTQNINNINDIEDVEGTPRNGSLNSYVHPSTYVQPSMKISSSSLGMNVGVSSIPWVPTLLAPQKWCLQPPKTKAVNDGFRREHGFPFALTSYMQTTNQQQDPHITYWQQPRNIQHQQHQVRSYQNLFNRDDSQPQDMAMPPQLWSHHTTMLGVIPKKDSFPFGI